MALSGIGTMQDAAVTDSTANATAIAALKGLLAEAALEVAILGATDGAAVITDADGTLQQYLRGLVKLIVAQITVDVDDISKGTQTNDVKVTLDGEQIAITPVEAAAADVHEPAANTAAVVTYAASAGVKHVITGVDWSYHGGIPTDGNLLIEDVSGTTVYSTDIHEEGPGDVIFPKPKKAAAVNTAMIITLAAGGAGVTGKVSVLNHWTEA